jgi:hypothetical protein
MVERLSSIAGSAVRNADGVNEKVAFLINSHGVLSSQKAVIKLFWDAC